MTECEKLRSDLKAFLDGQLSPAARIAMRLHLNRCASCRKEIEAMRTLGTRMRAADALEMSDALRERILAAVPTTAPEDGVRLLPKWREKPVLLWGASASAVLGWFILYPTLNNYQDQIARSSRVTSTNQIGLGAQLYAQDYDETRKAAAPPADPTLSFSAPDNINGKFDAPQGQVSTKLPADMVSNSIKKRPDDYQVTHGNLRIQAGGGRMDFRSSAPAGNSTWADNTRAQRYMPPIESTAASQVAQNIKAETPHAIRKWVFPKTMALQTTRGTLAPATDEVDLTTERQVHREASLTVEVANAEQQSEAVERLVKESRGYVAQNELTTQEDHTRQASLTCKVPVDQFETVMGQLARLGVLKGKSLTGEDITEKVSDAQETGHVLRADIATTEAKLKTRQRHSETVRDEETLRQLRIRVAQSQARLKMLTRLGALSEITVELDEKPKNAAPIEVKPASPFMAEVSGTGQAAAHSFLMALRLPIQLLVWIVVYSPLWALLIIAYRRMTR
jgi:hypothetical protein